MTPINPLMIKDRVIDFLFTHMPVLLQDDLVVEGICYLVLREVQQALAEERAKLLENVN